MTDHPKYGSLRAHQAQAIDEVERVAASGQKILVANITPGDAEKSLAVGEVPEPKAAPELPAGPGRGHKKAPGPLGPDVSERSGVEKRLARIARDAPGDVKDLFRAGLISDRAAAALSPAKKTPEKAAVIHAAVEQANAVVKAHGAPADAKSKRALKKRVDAVVRETLAPIVHRDVKPDSTSLPPAKRDVEGERRHLFTLLPTDRRLADALWTVGQLTASERRDLLSRISE